jgi:REP element-mobilizing transposase RayT
MPRGPRLDVPGALHHVTVRGERGSRVFRDAADREDFLARVGVLGQEGCWGVYAWAVLPDHAHLLVRTGSLPLARCMRRLLTGYAGAFNRRHKHQGRLFSDRYKSVVVDEEPYFLEFVRYVHLNPLRRRVVRDLAGLAAYPYAGHAALLGRVPRAWQDTEAVLAFFAPSPAEARQAYEAFVAAGARQGRRPELQGGGLLRSLGSRKALQALRQAGGRYAADERILGRSGFVERFREASAQHAVAEATRRQPGVTLDALIGRVADLFGVTPQGIFSPGRARPAAQARQLLTYLWVERLGRRASELAAALGRTRGNVSWSARRGAAIAQARAAEIEPWWAGLDPQSVARSDTPGSPSVDTRSFMP